jgi:hypothetical protein
MAWSAPPFSRTTRRMYTAILATHTIVRWLVLAAGAWAVFRSWRGWRARAVWESADAGAVKLYVNALSLQFVAGIVLYAVSPLIRGAMGDMGAAMRTPSVRYFVVEHVAVMLIAIALGHIGAAKIKRATSDSARFQTATIWMGISWAAAAGFVPWFRPILPSM